MRTLHIVLKPFLAINIKRRVCSGTISGAVQGCCCCQVCKSPGIIVIASSAIPRFPLASNPFSMSIWKLTCHRRRRRIIEEAAPMRFLHDPLSFAPNGASGFFHTLHTHTHTWAVRGSRNKARRTREEPELRPLSLLTYANP